MLGVDVVRSFVVAFAVVMVDFVVLLFGCKNNHPIPCCGAIHMFYQQYHCCCSNNCSWLHCLWSCVAGAVVVVANDAALVLSVVLVAEMVVVICVFVFVFVFVFFFGGEIFVVVSLVARQCAAF